MSDSSEKLWCLIEQDEITAEIGRLFDYAFEGMSTFVVPNLAGVPENFRIGLIIGPSGSGKSSLLGRFRKAGDPVWDEHRAIASHFESAGEASTKLAAVGLNSIPSWLRPYQVLSTGEKFRADLARQIANGAVIDEFTSVVDRSVAKSCSVAIRRYVDQANLSGIVLASCHYDIVEWLQPDWVFDTATAKMSYRGALQRRPPIDLEILPCSAEAWPMFSPHHYLTASLNKSARCWLAAWEGKPVAFAAALAFPNGNFVNAWREHRTVVLPDFQGLGIGVRLSDAIAKMFVDQGSRYFSKTAHPRMGAYRERSPLWKPTSKNGIARPDYVTNRAVKEAKHKAAHITRVCYSHEYVDVPVT